LTRLDDWHTVHGHLVRARTYRAQVQFVPGRVRPGQAWWYTHDRLRKAYRLLERLARDQTLFTHLDPDLPGLDTTTNKIEGGVNACLRTVLHHHRGMPIDHRRRAVDWWCHQHGENPTQLPDLARIALTSTPEPAPQPDPRDDHGQPARYDTGLTSEEGLWTRKGWAGRA
jgi:hypothetical protein